MEIKTTDVIIILNNMAKQFEILSIEYEEISTRDFSYDLLWSLVDSCKKQLKLSTAEMDFLESELRLHSIEACYFQDGGKASCSLLVPLTPKH